MKDPAFLFYTSDFLTGTMLFTDEQVGKYVRALCYIHQHGHISLEELNILLKEDNIVLKKFVKDKKNLYYNNRLEIEIEKETNSLIDKGLMAKKVVDQVTQLKPKTNP